MKYDTIKEVRVAKNFDEIVEVNKFNPFHDERGRFANKNGFKTYSANPKTTSGAKAITRSVDYKHGATINVHHESQGKTLDENAYWLKTGQKIPTAAEPKEIKPTKKPKPEAEPKTDTKAFGNDAIENGHEFYDKYGKIQGNTTQSVNAIKEATGCSNQKAIEMAKAIENFSGSSYEKIRAVQTGEKKAGSFNYSMYQKEGEALESFISDSPKWDGSGTALRGIRVDTKTAEDIIAKAQKGEPIDQKGTASWSSSENTAKSFAHWGASQDNGSQSILFVMEGGTMKGTSIKHLSQFSSENEILVSKTQRSKATSVQQTKDGWIIKVVELP